MELKTLMYFTYFQEDSVTKFYWALEQTYFHPNKAHVPVAVL